MATENISPKNGSIFLARERQKKRMRLLIGKRGQGRREAK